VSYCQVTPAEPSVVERAVQRRPSGISVLWMLATGPIADIHNIDALRLASVRPTGLIPPPGQVQFQSISTYSEHDALTSGRTESISVTFLVCTFGGGPSSNIHIVYIHLSPKLRDLCIHDLSGRMDGELLSSDSDRAITRRARGTKAPKRYFCTMDVGYGTHSRHP
jgi:hypothetical protein